MQWINCLCNACQTQHEKVQFIDGRWPGGLLRCPVCGSRDVRELPLPKSEYRTITPAIRDRNKRVQLKRHGIDAHRVLPGIYQGSRPPTGRALRNAGFSALVLAAEEHQPSASEFPGISVYHAPLNDHGRTLRGDEWDTIITAANFSATVARSGRRVLITCWQGVNRSGIITAVTTMMLTGNSARQAIGNLKRRRPGALRNTSFVAQLRALPL